MSIFEKPVYDTPQEIWCPGRFYRAGTRVDIPGKTAWQDSKSGAECAWCGQMVELFEADLERHRVTITIHKPT